MSNSQPPASEPGKTSAVSFTNVGEVIVGGDVVGRDKIVIVQFGAGLQALGKLIQESEGVKNAAAAFRADYEAATEQLGLLGDLKDLHDLLHQLQFECYTGIQRISTRFPNDEWALDDLHSYQLTLERILCQLHEVVARLANWQIGAEVVPEVTKAQVDLAAAVQQSEANSLKSCTRRLNRLLAIQPPRINTRLLSAASSLRLPALLKALTHVSQYLAGQPLAPDQVQEFNVAVQALVHLNHKLQSLLLAHERWQNIEDNLRLIENLIEGARSLDELELTWPDVKEEAGLLYAESSDDWAAGLRADGAALDEALAAANPTRARRAFRSYRHHAGVRFFEVDRKLKTFCGELREIGQPLTFILKMMG